MRKFLAIKIQCNSYMYIPRLPPRPVKPGQVPVLGTRVEAKIDIRFCHFFDGLGFKPRVEQKVKKCSFLLFSFFLRKEKPDNKILPSLIPPRVFKCSGIFYFFLFTRYRQIIGSPQRDILLLFFTHLPWKRFLRSSFPVTEVQTKAFRCFFM